MRTLTSILAAGAVAFALTLTGCGGDSGRGELGSGTGTGTGTTGTTTYEMGNGTGAAFQSGVIALSSTSLSAGGSTSLAISIVDRTGTLYASTTGVPVTINSPCIASGLATITATAGGAAVTSITTTSGIVQAVYTANGCSGSDVITATAAVGAQTLTASGTVTVAAAAVGSIQFVSAKPATIGLKGTGLNSTSTVIFKVVDSTGGPRANVPVTFTLDTTAGGITIAPETAMSGNDGTVQTVVSSGTVHTAVVVTATIATPALSTQSSALTITTGLPTSNAFTIAVGAPSYASGGQACSNVEAYTLALITVPVTVQLADRYGNPVLDGTAVAFTTDGGVLAGSCITGQTTPGNGECQVSWSSGSPIPSTNTSPPSYRNGRAMILATAIGEEYFDDKNASGYYVSGDPFSDLGEPYRDDNENGQYDLGEHFLDFNNNGVRDGPSGKFVGITCSNGSCSTSTLALGASHLLIMSTSGAAISSSVGSITGVHGSTSGTGFSVSIQDENGNPMAAGTTVTITSSIGTVSGTTSWTIGCRDGGGPDLTNPGADTLNLSFTPGATAGSGNVTISVTSPGTHTTTVANIPVTVT